MIKTYVANWMVAGDFLTPAEVNGMDYTKHMSANSHEFATWT